MPKELTTEVVRGSLLYLDINWKIRWAYSSRNYVNIVPDKILLIRYGFS